MSSPVGYNQYSSSGIPYPGGMDGSSEYRRRSSGYGQQMDRRSSGGYGPQMDRRGSGGYAPQMDRRGSAGYPGQQMGSMSPQGIGNPDMAMGSQQRDYQSGSMGSGNYGYDHQYSQQPEFPFKPIHEMDAAFNRMKIREQNSPGDGSTQNCNNGEQPGNDGQYSNYIANRMSRVLTDYYEIKGDEERQRQWTGQMRYGSNRRDSFYNANSKKNFPNLNQSSGIVQTGAQFSGDKGMKAGPESNSSIPNVGPGNKNYFVQTVEWFPMENAREHHTQFFHNMGRGMNKEVYRMNYHPILRRGQTFFFAVKFTSNTMMDWANNPLFVHFMLGSNPSLSKGTKVVLKMNGNRDFMNRDRYDEWDIRLHNQESNTLTLQVRIPPSSPVGVWNCQIQCGMYNEMGYDCQDDIYILFNPYCNEDPVYLDNEQNRYEYIQNEHGAVFQGTRDSPKPYEWVYGQFYDIILPMVVLFLDRYNDFNGNNFSDRSNPAFVSRSIASMMFSKHGVLRRSRRDEEDFSQISYTGTYPVFEKIIQQQFRPVDTKESFMASAIMVTFCRALGIPCRNVTVYRSPYEKSSLNVDMYWREENEKESDIYGAYHCWNDVYFRRDDIIQQKSLSYNGWQAIDPNDRGYGPAPAEAIRRGETGINFDVFYFYSMFNSKFRHYYDDVYPNEANMQEIGRLMVTKSQGMDDRNSYNSNYDDITQLYKSKDGRFDEQNMMVQKANKGALPPSGSMTMQRHSRSSRSSIQFRNSEGQSYSKDDLMAEWNFTPTALGQNIMSTFYVQNMGNEPRTMQLNMYARPLFHEGFIGHKLKEFKRTITLQPNQRETFQFEMNPRDYQDQLDSNYTIRFYGYVYNREMNRFCEANEDMCLTKPKLQIQTRSTPQVDTELQVNFNMMNPLNVPLTDCYLFVEGSGFTKPMYKRLKNIKPGEMMNITESFFPRKGGDSRMVVVFNSRQLRNVTSSKFMSVRD